MSEKEKGIAQDGQTMKMFPRKVNGGQIVKTPAKPIETGKKK